MAAPIGDLVASLRKSARHVMDERERGNSPDRLVSLLTESAVAMVPAAAGAGISRTAEQGLRAGHATSTIIRELDELQSTLNEGPCITAADEPTADGVVLTRDLAGDDGQRWPNFAPRVVEAGFRSTLSISLISSETGGPRSALNLYAPAPGAFDDDAVAIVSLFAGQAGALLYGADHTARLTGQFEIALANRDEIGQAKGILMERFSLDGAEAFAMLVKSSQDINIKVIDISRWLIGDGRPRRSKR